MMEAVEPHREDSLMKIPLQSERGWHHLLRQK